MFSDGNVYLFLHIRQSSNLLIHINRKRLALTKALVFSNMHRVTILVFRDIKLLDLVEI